MLNYERLIEEFEIEIDYKAPSYFRYLIDEYGIIFASERDKKRYYEYVVRYLKDYVNDNELFIDNEYLDDILNEYVDYDILDYFCEDEDIIIVNLPKELKEKYGDEKLC